MLIVELDGAFVIAIDSSDTRCDCEPDGITLLEGFPLLSRAPQASIRVVRSRVQGPEPDLAVPVLRHLERRHGANWRPSLGRPGQVQHVDEALWWYAEVDGARLGDRGDSAGDVVAKPATTPRGS
jgi:hypothetical protein